MFSVIRNSLNSRILAQVSRQELTARSFSSQKNGPKSSSIFKRRFLPALYLGLAGGFAVGIYMNYQKKGAKIGLDSSAISQSEVDLQPPTKVPPFPATISINKELFQALGTGVRTVTFLNFHVYAVGLYVAADDVYTVKKIFAELRPQLNPANDQKEWEKLLLDPEQGTKIASLLLKENVRFAVRIVPTRATDFSHLRDGFVRSVMNHPEFKSIQNEDVGQSISEIKRAFGRKLKLKKGEVITWSRNANGSMTAWYGDSDEDKEVLGTVPHPDVSRLFFLQYMSGSKPNSPTLKSSALKGLAGISS